VHVDKAGRNDKSGRVDDSLPVPHDAPNTDDAISIDGDLAVEPHVAGAIDDFTVANDQIVFRRGNVESREAKQGDAQRALEAAFHGYVAACAGTLGSARTHLAPAITSSWN
jgi:hypothetical protein